MGMGDQPAPGGDPEVIDLRALDRRDALKRGAVVASAALWATPVVQTVGISRAAAQQPSVIASTTTTSAELPTTTTTSTTEPSTTTTTGSTTTTTGSTTTTTRPPSGVICNIQIVVRKDGCLYGLRYDGHTWVQWSDRAPDALDCIRFYADHRNVEASWLLAFLFTVKVRVTKVNDSLWRMALPLPPGVQFVAGWGQVGDASVTGCKKALVSSSSIDFSAG